ncbi:hypothetical protein CAPTEDRAFT_203294 [Capitella teleta]|uniref:Uncharacterized protein n=1 Tax=Capitella teleta TaxID=283909 RepID=R7TTI7_CAPTE|nr:hypothetical protein CAPTEDRAFT_203294 [Capitella teleta]|eukprot:ELT96922.1 hypothetical protein CAPTEDRAFT_203294 [Capitella teleta]
MDFNPPLRSRVMLIKRYGQVIYHLPLSSSGKDYYQSCPISTFNHLLSIYSKQKISKLGCGGSNTNKTVCNSLLELMTVSAQSGFNSWGFNNSMHRYLHKSQFILNQS